MPAFTRVQSSTPPASGAEGNPNGSLLTPPVVSVAPETMPGAPNDASLIKIKAEGVNLYYGTKHALKNVSARM